MLSNKNDVVATVTWLNDSRDSPGGSTMERFNLRANDQLNFGVLSQTGRFKPHGTPCVGAFEVSDNHLFISNFTTSATYVIENLEGGIELIKVRPRQVRVPVPFEMSRILIPSKETIVELTVFGSPPRLIGEDQSIRELCAPTFNVDTASKYFAVLVALCEPRLRGSSMAAVPSAKEVVERLKGSAQFRDANRSSINYHIDYLADHKLSVNRWAKYIEKGRMHSKREALAAFALRFDIVREEHLDLLP
jgi:hypothetical protein